jgi:hypothetical protein
MGFANVYGQKISVILVIIENAHDVADLATERRSGEAAENQDQRLSASSFANMKRVGAIERKKFGVGRAIALPQVAAMHMREGVAHHV